MQEPIILVFLAILSRILSKLFHFSHLQFVHHVFSRTFRPLTPYFHSSSLLSFNLPPPPLPTNCMTQRLQHVTFVMQKRALLSIYHHLFVYLSLYPCCILSFNLCGGRRRLSIYRSVCLSLATTRHYNTTQYFLYSSSSVGNTHSSLQGHHLYYQ